MTEKQITSISKLMSLALRHDPSALGLTLNEQGWVSVESLLKGLAQKGKEISPEELDVVVETNNKKRFAYSDDKFLIRASQGHSLEVDLELEAIKPPDFLFHGTAVDNVESILKDGIEKRKRIHVHLSSDKETATNVGSRHGKPVILIILAGKMYEDGLSFYLSANGVWLTDFIPANYIKTSMPLG